MKRFVIYMFILTLAIALSSCHTRKKAMEGLDIAEVTTAHKAKTKITKDRARIVEVAQGWLGVPYKYGGNSKEEGTDCSGMVLQVYLEACDIKLPRNSAAQAEFSQTIKLSEIKPGDLVFFATGKNPEKVSHVGIMIDEDQFIHSSTSKGVCISKLSSPYYQRTFIMCGSIEGVN